MSNVRNLVLIPYQDMYNYMNDGILTREYAILHHLSCLDNFDLTIINKPRTKLSQKKIHIDLKRFPRNSIEAQVKNLIEESCIISPQKLIDFEEISLRRGWWVESYLLAIEELESSVCVGEETLVYSNNPFAYKLISWFKDRGARVIFDAMDNLCSFPQLKSAEQDIAFKGYGEMAITADFFSCNSLRTQRFMSKYFNRIPTLIKNGTFPLREIDLNEEPAQIKTLMDEGVNYRYKVGYIGKFGLKMDDALIKEVCEMLPDYLFVFIGPDSSGKTSFAYKIRNVDNALCLSGIPSAYVYYLLNSFDILTIPYSVGKMENSGDPLKLYQYMMTKKPIISTPIQGVDEFSESIGIRELSSEWAHWIESNVDKPCNYGSLSNSFLWETRLRPLADFVEEYVICSDSS